MSQDAYAVEGYGVRNPEYDGKYLDGDSVDPKVKFAFAGDAQKAADFQKVLADTEGAPVLSGGGVTIKTASGEPNVVVLTKEPEDTKTIVLGSTPVEEKDPVIKSEDPPTPSTPGVTLS